MAEPEKKRPKIADLPLAVQASLLSALEELSKWPEMSGIKYHVLVKNEEGDLEPQLRQVPPSEMTGVFESLLRHTEANLPFGQDCLRAGQSIDGLRAKAGILGRDIETYNNPGANEDARAMVPYRVLRRWINELMGMKR